MAEKRGGPGRANATQAQRGMTWSGPVSGPLWLCRSCKGEKQERNVARLAVITLLLECQLTDFGRVRK